MMKIKKKIGSQTWKTLKSQKILTCPPKKIPTWFSITIIDPICFMKFLYSLSPHWCFQKIIGSELAFCGGLIHLNNMQNPLLWRWQTEQRKSNTFLQAFLAMHNCPLLTIFYLTDPLYPGLFNKQFREGFN